MNDAHGIEIRLHDYVEPLHAGEGGLMVVGIEDSINRVDLLKFDSQTLAFRAVKAVPSTIAVRLLPDDPRLEGISGSAFEFAQSRQDAETE